MNHVYHTEEQVDYKMCSLFIQVWLPENISLPLCDTVKQENKFACFVNLHCN